MTGMAVAAGIGQLKVAETPLAELWFVSKIVCGETPLLTVGALCTCSLGGILLELAKDIGDSHT